VILLALFTYALWFASPEIYSDLIGPDRERSEQGVMDFLVGTLSGAGA
jgi:hypothetical protein